MYEVVKIVKGYEITRMVGTHGCYWVTLWDNGRGFKKQTSFRTIKAASKFIEETL